MRRRPFEVAIGCFDGSFSNAHFFCLTIISHRRLQPHPPLATDCVDLATISHRRLQPHLPLATDCVDLAIHILDQRHFLLLSINTYLFTLVSRTPILILHPSLTHLQGILSAPFATSPAPLFSPAPFFSISNCKYLRCSNIRPFKCSDQQTISDACS